MAVDKISELVADKAFSDLAKLEVALEGNVLAFKEAIEVANQYNQVLGKSATPRDFVDNQVKAAKALGDVEGATEKTRLAEIRLQQAREKNIDDYNAKIAKQDAAQEKASIKDEQRAAKTILNDEKKRLSDIKLERDREKNIDAYNDRLAKQEAAVKKAEAAQAKLNAKAAEAARPFNQLKKDLADAEGAAADIGVTFGKSSPQFTEATANVQKLRKQVDGIEQPLGKFQRNVGNYFNQAYGLVRTAANILPGLGISGIFLALGTGIKFLIDELSAGKFSLDSFAASASALNKAFDSASYKAAISSVIELKQQFKDAGEDVSLQQLALTKYNETIGKTVGQTNDLNTAEKTLNANANEYIKSIFYKAAASAALADGTEDLVKATKSLLNAQANQALSNKDVAQLQNTIKTSRDKDEVAQAKYLLSIGNNAKKADDERLKDAQSYVNKLTNQTTAVYSKLTELSNKFSSNLNGADKTGVDNERVKNFVEVAKIQLQTEIDTQNAIAENDKKSYSKRRAAASQSAKLQIQLIEYTQNQELLSATITADQREVIENKNAAQIATIRRGLTKRLQEFTLSEREDKIKNAEADLKRDQAANKRVFENTENSLDDRLAANEKYVSNSLLLLKKETDLKVSQAGENSIQISTIQKEANAERDNIEREGQNNRQKLEKEANAILLKLFRDGIKNQENAESESINVVKEAGQKRLQVIEDNRDEALLALSQQYASQKIGLDAYNQQKSDIEHAAAQDSIRTQIAVQEAIIGVQKSFLQFGIGSNKELGNSEQQLASLKLKLSKDVTDQQLSDSEKIKQKRLKDIDLEKEATDELQAFIVSVIKGRSDAQLADLQKQSDQIDKNTERELKANDRVLQSDQQRSDKAELINAQASAQKEAILQRENDIKNAQAKADRVAAIASIVTNTAVAIVKTLGETGFFGIPLTAIVAGIGALQLGAVLATPLPKFRGGVRDWRGGDAIIGDGGSEIARLPDGSMYLSPNSDTRVSLPAGSDVFTHAETMRMLAKPDVSVMPSSGVDGGMREVVAAVNSGTKKTVAAMSRSSKVQVNGWMSESKQAEKWGRIYANYKKN